MSREPKQLFEGTCYSFFDDGTMGFSDGVGYVDTAEKDEVRRLYEALHKYFKGKPAPRSEGKPSQETGCHIILDGAAHIVPHVEGADGHCQRCDKPAAQGKCRQCGSSLTDKGNCARTMQVLKRLRQASPGGQP